MSTTRSTSRLLTRASLGRMLCVLSLACMTLFSTSAAAAQLLAVLELSGDLPAKQRQALTDAIRQAAMDAAASSGIKVMTQENMETLLTDMGIDASCVTEGACEVDTLRNLQANYGVTGKVTDFEGTYVVTLQLYDTRSGTMMGSQSAKSKHALELFDPLVPDATRALLTPLSSAPPPSADEAVVPAPRPSADEAVVPAPRPSADEAVVPAPPVGPVSPPTVDVTPKRTQPFPSTPPTVTPDDSWMPTAPTVQQTIAGAPMWHAHRPGLPLVSLRLVVPGGSSLDPAEQPGLTALSDAMLLRGAAGRDSAAFSAALQADAISLGVDTYRTATVVSLDCTTQALPAALDLLADALTAPRFDADEVARAQQQWIQYRKDAADDPRIVASEVGWRLWFGPDSPHAHPPDGTVAGLQALDAPTLAASWSMRSRPGSTRWVAVGDIESGELTRLLEERLGGWGSPASSPSLDLPPPPGTRGPHLSGGRVLVDNPGASQTVLRVMLPAWAPEDPMRVAGDLGVVALGGTFTSRLNALLREEKGYTYGARADLYTGRGYGVVVASTNVFGDVTGPALTDLSTELVRIRDGVSAQEAGKARASGRTDAIETAASRSGTADMLVGLALDGRPADGQVADLRLGARADASDISRALRRLQLDKALVVVVGDLEEVGEAVTSAMPGAWQQVDATGEVVQP